MASYQASKRLVDAGIILNTNVRWYDHKSDDHQSPALTSELDDSMKSVPAPSLADLWPIMPTKLVINRDYYFLEMEKHSNGQNTVYYRTGNRPPIWTRNTNLADALINLLVYLKIMHHLCPV
jgi:hypothetical protein